MKSAIVAASFLTSLALATPVMEEKRYYVTQWDVETATVTVTGSSGWGGWGNWGKQSSTAAPVTSTVVPTSTIAPSTTVIPTSTAAASSSWSAWTSSSAVSSVPVASSASASASSTAGLSDYATPIVAQHNLHRSNHSAPDIEWDDDLASIAAQIAASCVYAHDTSTGGGGYGQNIGAGAPGDQVNQMITNEMYNDEMMYYPGYGSEPDMSNFENWGHFSQIVWKSSTSLGCATQYCPGGLANVGSGVSPYFTVCNYKPAGNFGGEYAANVLAPQGAPIDVVS